MTTPIRTTIENEYTYSYRSLTRKILFVIFRNRVTGEWIICNDSTHSLSIMKTKTTPMFTFDFDKTSRHKCKCCCVSSSTEEHRCQLRRTVYLLCCIKVYVCSTSSIKWISLSVVCSYSYYGDPQANGGL